jgi:hypothetical protein
LPNAMVTNFGHGEGRVHPENRNPSPRNGRLLCNLPGGYGSLWSRIATLKDEELAQD